MVAAHEELARTVRECHVLIVDDASPDGTGTIADRLASENPSVEVLHRAVKEGLGRAYLAGFHYALSRGADLVIEMDADDSHNPRDLPRLVAAAAAADLVLGSRYVEGGESGIGRFGVVSLAAVVRGTRVACSVSRFAISQAASSAFKATLSTPLTIWTHTPAAMAFKSS